MIYFCRDDRRRTAIRNQSVLNGIDFLEVSDNASDPAPDRQRTLFVHFFHPLAPGAVQKNNLAIEGGERIRNIGVESVSSPAPDTLQVKVTQAGDFSIYTLRLVQEAANFDPMFSAVDFSFKVACPSDFDCQTKRVCPPDTGTGPELNYLAKDYESFRQLMLDRIATLAPDWSERNPADSGIALVELLAYVADRLSYKQDAIATEAYLGTARLRTSVRRHARLVDYRMHDGSNARVWVQVLAAAGVNGTVLQRTSGGTPTRFISRIPETPPLLRPGSADFEKSLSGKPEIFEPLEDLTLFEAHNELHFYTWNAQECCLPKGATQATLEGAEPNLHPGQVLILVEALGPHTGTPQDADPTRRQALRLTDAHVSSDPLGNIAVTEIAWAAEDALQFPFCVSARQGTAFFPNVSVALGNIVLADHGLTIASEDLDAVPQPNPVVVAPPRFRPSLKQSPVTQAAAYDPANTGSALSAMAWSMDTVLPAITLLGSDSPGPWHPRRDLLQSAAEDRDFVLETEADGTAYLRFGDDRSGARPVPGERLTATYRLGNGKQGNIGADSLAHLVCADSAITDQVVTAIRNPLPAVGGRDLETIEEVRQSAPVAFRTQDRAVTASDYAALAPRCAAGVQRAAATFRWTGSWRTVFLTVDRLGGKDVDAGFKAALRTCVDQYRMAGVDVEVDGPRLVALFVQMNVCAQPGYRAGDIEAALLDVFSNRDLPDGRRGLFHPDNFSFGQTVYLSPLYAAAQSIAGVSSVEITRFERQGTPASSALTTGRLDMGRLEIALLDNDPSLRERGAIDLTVRGGS